MIKTTCGSNAQAASIFLTKFPLHFLDQSQGVFLNGTLEFSHGFEPDAEFNSVPSVRQVAGLTGINGPFWS